MVRAYLHAGLSRVRALFTGRHSEADLDEEIQAHLDLFTEDNRRRGMSEEEARTAARRAFGGVDQTKESYRDQRGLPWVDALVRDIRYGARTLLRSPGFTSAAVLSLALGIGANTTILTLINAVFWKPLQVEDPDTLVLVTVPGSEGGESFSYPLYQRFREQSTALTGIAASGGFSRMRLVMGTPASSLVAESVLTQAVSGNFFSVLGVDAVIGRVLSDDDDRSGAPRAVVVISHDFWAHRLNRDPRIVGQDITLNDTSFTVVGVSPEGFTGFEIGAMPALWWPMAMLPSVRPASKNLLGPGSSWMRLMGRLTSGASVTSAQAELNVMFQRDLMDTARRRAATLTDAQRESLLSRRVALQSGRTGWTWLRRPYARPLVILMTLVGVALLIACVNIANLLLTRATARRREMAVRLALGASRGRLIRQLLTESLLLATTGAVCGLAVSQAGTRLLLKYLPAAPGSLDVSPDGRILGLTVALAVVTSPLVGLIPAFSATRRDLASRLKGPGAAGGDKRGLTLSNTFVIAQVSLSLCLLTSAGLLGRTLQNLRGLDTGFDREDVTVFSVDVPTGYDAAQRASLFARIRERLEVLPGTRAATFSTFGLLRGSYWTERIAVAGSGASADEDTTCSAMLVGPGFFETLGTAVRRGRPLELADVETNAHVAVVNEAMARRFFSGGDALGGRFQIAGWTGEPFEIVGIVADAKHRTLREAAPPTFYVPFFHRSVSDVTFALRANTQLGGLAEPIRRTVHDIDPRVQTFETTTMADVVDQSVMQERLMALLGLLFGGFALLLAGIGLYGVRAYAVAQRWREIGLRVACGATREDILRMVLRGGLILTVTGVAFGVPLGLAAGHMMQSVLFGLEPADPATIMLAAALMVTVSMIAGWLPARRAMAVPPAIVLREE